MFNLTLKEMKFNIAVDWENEKLPSFWKWPGAEKNRSDNLGLGRSW